MKRNEMKKEKKKLIARESKNGTESEMIFLVEDPGLYLFRIHMTVTKNNKYVTLDKITHMKGSMQLMQ